ncbi:hypothetical protein OAA19_01785 [Rubripirellula sp.]|nr:hypothetical protein [Rubripirellula sp.]MDB4338818.1 hypothetical protein [Rubripirellula sp.]
MHDNIKISKPGFPTIRVSAVACILITGAVLAVNLSRETKPDYSNHFTHQIQRGSMTVTVNEQGLLESNENHEIKSKVRGRNAVIWIVDSGTVVAEGDELVRLDALFIQEQVDERTKYANWSQSGADSSATRVARAKIAVEEYQQGRFETERLTLQKGIVIAEANVQSGLDQLNHTRMMASSGYTNELEIEAKQFAVKQAALDLELKRTQLEVLEKFTFKEQLQTLSGQLTSVEATHRANVERAMADESRKARAVEELQYCVIKADRPGLVIHPNAAKWEMAPIAEGTNVYRDQVLLLMPNLQKMQVKIGVHESTVKRVKPGQNVSVNIVGRTYQGTVSEVASITKPAGWWTGNQVKYDTLISLDPDENHLPGMSAEVEITVANYENVLKIPIAALVEIDDFAHCWVPTDQGPEKRSITIGDRNESYALVEQGIEAGDEVFLNPYAFETIETQSVNLTNSSEATDTVTQQPDKTGKQKIDKQKNKPAAISKKPAGTGKAK